MPKTVSWRTLLALSVFTICGPLTVLQAAPALEPLATARLIAAPEMRDGVWTVGVEVALKDGAITYWRDPGEAGVPPRFDFAASENVKSAMVAFPVPKRIHEGDIDAIGYTGTVVFPVRVTPSDPGKATIVHLRLDYATCERICLPAHADLTLPLPAPSALTDAAAVASAVATLPRVLDGAEARAIASVTESAGGDAISWLVTPKGGDGTTDLFAEVPEGFFVSTKRESDGFRVAVVEHPAGQRTPSTIRFTLVTSGKGVEFTFAPKS